MKFSGVNTTDRSDVHANGQGQRSNVKATEVTTQFSHFRTITPVWIYIWRWNDAQSLMWHRIGALLFLKVIRLISRSHGTKKSPILTRIGRFWTVTPVWIHWWLWNDAQSLTYHRRGLPYCFFRSSIKFQGHTGQKIDDLNPTWVILQGRSQLSNPSDWPCFLSCDQAALWMVLSICPSVCLSQLFRCFCHHIIMKFSEVIIIDRSDVHGKS